MDKLLFPKCWICEQHVKKGALWLHIKTDHRECNNTKPQAAAPIARNQKNGETLNSEDTLSGAEKELKVPVGVPRTKTTYSRKPSGKCDRVLKDEKEPKVRARVPRRTNAQLSDTMEEALEAGEKEPEVSVGIQRTKTRYPLFPKCWICKQSIKRRALWLHIKTEHRERNNTKPQDEAPVVRNTKNGKTNSKESLSGAEQEQVPVGVPRTKTTYSRNPSDTSERVLKDEIKKTRVRARVPRTTSDTQLSGTSEETLKAGKKEPEVPVVVSRTKPRYPMSLCQSRDSSTHYSPDHCVSVESTAAERHTETSNSYRECKSTSHQQKAEPMLSPILEESMTSSPSVISHKQSAKQTVTRRFPAILCPEDNLTSLHGEYANNPEAKFKALQKKMHIFKKDIKPVQKEANSMLEKLLPILNEKSNMNWKVLESGSYYDMTQIIAPSEIDYMLIPTAIRCTPDFYPDSPGFCGVKLVSPSPLLQSCCNSDGMLLVDKFRESIFSLFHEIIFTEGEFHPGRRMTRVARDPGSPAFTVEYNKSLEIDFVPALEFEGWPQDAKNVDPKWIHDKSVLSECGKKYHVVAKSYISGKRSDYIWRISFSFTENILLRHADDSDMETCRRHTLRVLKMCLAECKEKISTRTVWKLASFHLKTYMLHVFDSWPNDDSWKKGRDERSRLMNCLHQLRRIFAPNNSPPFLENYFIKKDNILKFVPQDEVKILREELAQYVRTF
ncbi:hypothetical protein ScPMuIL_008692 [Solemya velum]